MDIEKIFENNRMWAQEKRQKNPSYFNDLSKGQSPNALYIGCSDSRVAAEEIMGCAPGELFVLRNVANLVNNLDLGATAVIEYAVSILKVKHIIICGHYECGGIAAAMQAKDYGLITPWLRSIKDVYNFHKKTLHAIKNPKERNKKLTDLCVIRQCHNLLHIPSVRAAFVQKKIHIHGWIFDISEGHLKNLSVEKKAILEGLYEYRHNETKG